MYKLTEWIRVLTMSTDAYSINDMANDMANNMLDDMATNYYAISHSNIHTAVNKKRHIKYFQRCLDVLPPRLAAHDSTR